MLLLFLLLGDSLEIGNFNEGEKRWRPPHHLRFCAEITKAIGHGSISLEKRSRAVVLPSSIISPGPALYPPPGLARSSVNFFSFMVIKLVLAQIQFVAVLIVASVVLLPFITGAALLLWKDDLLLVRARTSRTAPIDPMHVTIPRSLRISFLTKMWSRGGRNHAHTYRR